MKNLINLIVLLFIFSTLNSCKNDNKTVEPVLTGSDTVVIDSISKKTVDSTLVEHDYIQDNQTINSFNYNPIKPSNGTMKAVVELGAEGFNYFVINVDDDDNWEVLTKEFGNSMVLENMATESDITNGLKNYIAEILNSDKAKMNGSNIHFVVSSGASKDDKVKEISKSLKKLGYVVNEVTPQQEAYYGYLCAVPKSFRDKSFVLDIGSGNTKIGFSEDGNFEGLETFGAKYYKLDESDEAVYNHVSTEASKIPNNLRQICFIIGGVPYNLASKDRSGDERYTVLSTNINDYKSVEEDKGEKVHSGLNIYRAVLDETQVQEVVFDWDANFTIGFLLSL